MPSGLVEEHNGMAARPDHCSNLGQVQVHRFGVAGRQDEGGALTLLRADGTEDIGRGGALVAWR